MKTYVYFASILGLISAGCAFGTVAGDDNQSTHDAGHLPLDAGTHDAKVQTQDAAQTQTDASEIPDTTTTTTCDPLPLSTGDSTCDTCLGASCCAEDQACGNDIDCMNFINCVDSCPLDGGVPDPTCQSGCDSSYPTGSSELYSLDQCLSTLCRTDCGL